MARNSRAAIMGILNTFYILFKSDTSDLKKGTQEADRLQKGLQQSIKKTSDETKDLGKNFTKVVEQAAVALGVTLSGVGVALKLFDTAKINSGLQVQGKILSQNVTDILSYGQAVKAAGGDVGAFQAYLQSATQQAAQAGLQLPPLADFFREIRHELEGLSGNEKLRRLNLLGITDPGMISLLESSNAEFERSISAAKEFAKVADKDTQAARDFEKAWSDTSAGVTTAFTDLGTIVLPLLTKILNILNTPLEIPDWLAAVIPDFFLEKIPKGSRVLSHPDLDKQEKEELQKQGDSDAVKSLPFRKGASSESMKFWLSQGYSRAQAAALVANEQRESNFNPSAIGDNGQAKGIFQWHPDRRQRILASTGIDIDKAGHADQLKAAAWELQNMGISAALRAQATPEGAADLLTRKFERPANTAYESMLRSQMARENYNSGLFSDVGAGNAALGSSAATSLANSPTVNNGGDKNVTIKVDTITVNTQATDADSIAAGIASGIQNHFRDVVSNYDDGVRA